MRKMGAKAVVIAFAGVLAIGGAVGGTIAWLTDGSKTVTNTFAVGDVEITFEELGEAADESAVAKQFKIVPGTSEEKNPLVTVKADSEDCYVFVVVTDTNTKLTSENKQVVTWTLRDYMGSANSTEVTTLTNGWYSVASDGFNKTVYVREVTSDDDDQLFYLLTGDTTYPNGAVSYSDDLTKEDLALLEAQASSKGISLTFQVYAIQKAGITSATGTPGDTAYEAWKKLGVTL